VVAGAKAAVAAVGWAASAVMLELEMVVLVSARQLWDCRAEILQLQLYSSFCDRKTFTSSHWRKQL